jgi:hypothetical protein
MRVPTWWPLNWWPFCAHYKWEWVGNVYGDIILLANGKRSWFECVDCGVRRMRPYLAGPDYGPDADGLTYREYVGHGFDFPIIIAPGDIG